MAYKPSTPNYRVNKVHSYDDFVSREKSKHKKEELKDLAGSFKKNTDEGGRIPKNTKLRYNDKTRKMDDVSREIVLDELGYSTNESVTQMNIASMSRFINDYKKNHNDFENRGLEEGLSLIRKSENMHEALLKINDKIEMWKSGKIGKSMDREKVDSIVNGMLDLANHIRETIHE